MPSMRAELAAAAVLFACASAHAESVKLLVQRSPLAGFQYYAGAALWDRMKPGDRLDLAREPDNAHDANAVRVEWRGNKLGYLPRAENRTVAREMDRGALVEGRIARLAEHRNPWRRLRVDVWLVMP